MSDPLHHLIELQAALGEGRPIPTEVAQWLSDGIQRAVARGERLDEGLGLGGVGIRSLQRRLAHLRRDQHLAAAARCTTLGPASISTWEQVTRLAPLVAEFVDEWPRLRRLAEAPADWPGWKVHVFRAAQCDVPLPCSPRQLKAVIDDATAGRIPPFSSTRDSDDDRAQ